ncbi:MAG: flagellar hook-length control protein FliK [Candidatus Eremiobacteraeota bacterium]|nr:flagellar hook-length control protein FliK [Candidatus Eremiobacteraeota bacterium]
MNLLNVLGASAGAAQPKSGKHASQIDSSAQPVVAPQGSNPQPVAASSFAALFASIAPPPKTVSAEPLAQLTALVQRGTPLRTVVDRLAQQLATAIARRLHVRGNASGSLSRTLARSIARSLAPPGNAPPEGAAEAVAALAQRLQKWIATLTEGKNGLSGQQNDIAGKLLDANSAKEIPAQQKPDSSTPQSVDPAALARALLDSVASTLLPAPTAPAPANSSTSSVQSPAENAASVQAAAPSVPAITMANAPDLLARMLVRASGVDVRLNGTGAQPSQAGDAVSTDAAPSEILARFARSLQTDGSGSGSSFAQQQNDKTAAQESQEDSAPQIDSAVTANAPIVSTPASAPVTTASRPLVDPDSVVEQVVKSMMMRTTQSGSSEIHLHLSPEHLGDVMMKITVTGSSITANVVAQNGEVRGALLANQQQLVRSLSDAGMTLSGFSVDVSGGDAKRDSHERRAGGSGRRFAVHELGGATEDENAQAPVLGPPLRSDPRLDLLNYLA